MDKSTNTNLPLEEKEGGMYSLISVPVVTVRLKKASWISHTDCPEEKCP